MLETSREEGAPSSRSYSRERWKYGAEQAITAKTCIHYSSWFLRECWCSHVCGNLLTDSRYSHEESHENGRPVKVAHCDCLTRCRGEWMVWTGIQNASIDWYMLTKFPGHQQGRKTQLENTGFGRYILLCHIPVFAITSHQSVFKAWSARDCLLWTQSSTNVLDPNNEISLCFREHTTSIKGLTAYGLTANTQMDWEKW